MLRSLWVEGNIVCTLISLDGISRQEKGSASFKGTNPEAQIRFSKSETFNFTLKIKEYEGQNLLTRITERSRKGELDFRVFPLGSPRASYNGGKDFSLHPTKVKQDIDLGDIVILGGWKGGVGTINVQLSLEEITG